jgi:sirohydrochlorin cobaltochelatase
VSHADYADATLVVLGHGTTLNAESGAPVFQHAAALRERNCFAAVREAFWKQEPQIKAVLAGVTTPRAFIVPLFISEGYFSEEVIPRELGFRGEGREFSRVRSEAGRTQYYCRALGTHESMTEVLLARALEVATRFPFPRAPRPQDTTLFVAGHGTEQNENSRKAIERQVELLRNRNLYAAVEGVFMEESPRIGDCYTLAATRQVVVVPFFISEGLHTQEDIPVMLGEPKHVVQQRRQRGQPAWRNPTERKGKLVWYAASVGSAPQMTNVILERVAEAARLVFRLKPGG